MVRYLFSIFFILVVFLGNTQLTNGTIKVRKQNKKIIGKTLSLFDLRTRECGTIFFESDSECRVTFSYEKEELKNLKIFLNSDQNSKTIECDYELITDTSFVITNEDYSDTCFYRFLNEDNNMVRFNNTPQGVFDNNSYAFFYGFDSVIYSQSFLQSQRDLLFTDSILMIDSIYKNIRNKERREQLNEELKSRIAEYKSAISYNYFVGKFSRNGRQINLLNKNSSPFGHLFLQQKGDFYTLFSHSTFDASFPLVSNYTHKVYGKIQLKYDTAYVQYQEFNPAKINFTTMEFKGEKDKFLTNYPIASNFYLYREGDTLWVTNSVFMEMVKFKNSIGGFYSNYYQSLNGNKLKKESLYFTASKAYSTSNIEFKDTLAQWNYCIKNGVMFLYNEDDTLIDEMKNGYESFRFTYKNGQPFVFGAYSYKNRADNNYEFILLFENNKGVKLTCTQNEYKHAREAIKKGQIAEKEGITYEYFMYSASDEYIWAEYENGGLEEYNFFNFNKAIRIGKGRNAKSFYLVD